MLGLPTVARRKTEHCLCTKRQRSTRGRHYGGGCAKFLIPNGVGAVDRVVPLLIIFVFCQQMACFGAFIKKCFTL